MLRASPNLLMIQRGSRVLRMWIAAVCAIALVIVNVAHVYGHAVQPLSSVTSQLDNSVPDSGNDFPDASGAVDHCHGCTLIAVNATAPVVVLSVIESAPVPSLSGVYIPTPTSTDTPPPKSTT